MVEAVGHADGDLDPVVGRLEPGVGVSKPDGSDDVGPSSVVPEFLRTLVFARPRGDDQFADCTFSPSLDMSR